MIRSGLSPLVGTHPPRNVRSSPGAPPPSRRKCCGPPPAQTRSDRVEPTRSRGGGGGDGPPSRGPSHGAGTGRSPRRPIPIGDRKSTRLNSSHITISYAVFCLKKKKKQ